jgi:hypothetical protein
MIIVLIYLYILFVGSPLVILRREYLDITGNFCAAKLIEYFRHWTKWKLKNHRTPWVYQPLKKIYADLMGEHSLHIIRSAIALLEDMGIIEKQKNPGNGQDKTWQYKLNLEVLNRLLEHPKLKTEHSEFTVEQHHRSHPEVSKPQQHIAVEFKKNEEVEKENLDKQVLATPFVEKTELLHLINETDSGEGKFSAAEFVPKSSQEVLVEPAQATHYVDESELDDYASDSVEKFSSPSQQEVQDVLQQLREIPCTPQFRLNCEIQRTVKRCWENVPGAISEA